MNLRKTAVTYLGWCPGVEAASSFLPDRDIPPMRLLLAVTLLASVSASSYLASNRLLLWAGFPASTRLEIDNTHLDLEANGDSLLLSIDVETEIPSVEGYPSYLNSSIYTATIALDGSILTASRVIALGDAHPFHDLLVTRDGRWIAAFNYWEPRGVGSVTRSGLLVTESTDGVHWSDPVDVTGGQLVVENSPVSLVEAEVGVFLLFESSHGWMYTVSGEEGWTPPEPSPLDAVSQSAFTDEHGNVGVVGSMVDPSKFEVVQEEGIVTATLTDDVWVASGYLNQSGVPVTGDYPKILYSRSHHGYFMVTRHPAFPSSKDIQVYYSPDMKDWALKTHFLGAWEGCLTEHTDGTLAAVYMVFGEPRSTNIYVTSSQDGDHWTTPSSIELIVDTDAVEAAPQTMRTVASTAVSVLATLLAVVALVKNPGIILGA